MNLFSENKDKQDRVAIGNQNIMHMFISSSSSFLFSQVSKRRPALRQPGSFILSAHRWDSGWGFQYCKPAHKELVTQFREWLWLVQQF